MEGNQRGVARALVAAVATIVLSMSSSYVLTFAETPWQRVVLLSLLFVCMATLVVAFVLALVAQICADQTIEINSNDYERGLNPMSGNDLRESRAENCQTSRVQPDCNQGHSLRTGNTAARRLLLLTDVFLIASAGICLFIAVFAYVLALVYL